MRKPQIELSALGPFCNMPSKKSARPLVFGIIRAGRDEAQLTAILRDPRSKLAILGRVLPGVMSPPHPHDSLPIPQEANIEGILAAACGAQVGERRAPAGELQYSTQR